MNSNLKVCDPFVILGTYVHYIDDLAVPFFLRRFSDLIGCVGRLTDQPRELCVSRPRSFEPTQGDISSHSSDVSSGM